MQFEKQKHKIHIYTQINLAHWSAPSVTKPNPENCENYSSKCAYDWAKQLYTQSSSDNLTVAQTLSIRREGIQDTQISTLFVVFHIFVVGQDRL